MLRERWQRFWYVPGSAAALGVCRMLFYASVAAFYWRGQVVDWAEVSPVFWAPVSFFGVLGIGVLPAAALSAAFLAWMALLILSAAGLATRVSTAGAALLGTYLIGLPHNFGKIHHDSGILVFAMIILAFSRSGDGWSLDALLRAARRPRDTSAQKSPKSGEYTWPLRMMWLVMSLIFFAAGVSKLRHSGLAWVTSNAMAGYLIRSNDPLAHAAGAPWTDWGLWIAGVPWLTTLLGGVALALELLFPLALFSRTARRIVPAGVFFVQVGIAAVMGPDFDRFLVCYLFWVPWDRLGEIITTGRRAAATGPRHAFLYDGSCRLCQKTAAVLRRLDVLGRIAFIDALADWPRARTAFPSLAQDECLRTMHVVTARGRIERGFDAYRAISWSLPLFWPVAALLYVPGVPAAGRRVYAAVAARRHRTGCPLPERPTLSA